jgi:hypothetical protein
VSERLVRGAQPGVWVLRAVTAVSVLVALLAGVGVGDTPPPVVVVVVVLGALGSAFRPEHLSLSITLGLVVVWWALELHGSMPAVVLVVAAGLLLAHVGATLLSYGPPSLPLDRGLTLLWVARAGLAWLAALAVWVVARVYSGHGTPALFWLAGLAAGVVGAVVAGAAAPLRDHADR